ncbi:MAG: hypothetical protein AAF764_07850, partial [Pseudomonadota bacterium]
MTGNYLMRQIALAAALGVSGCTTTNAPLNVFEPSLASESNLVVASPDDAPAEVIGSNYVGLAFSGGGTRAAAFAYGMMQQMHAT